MKIKNHLWEKLEAVIVIILITVNLGFDVSPLPLIGTIFNLVSYLGIIIIAGTQWKRISYLATKDKTLMLLVALAVFSVYWSESPANTVRKLLDLTMTTIFGLYLASRYSIREQMRLLSWSVILAAILSLAVAILIPSYGTMEGGLWKGIFPEKQTLGRLMAFGFSLFIVKIFSQYNKRWLIISAIPIALILLSQSKSSLILVIVCISILPIYKLSQLKFKFRVVITLIIILFIACISDIIINNLEFIVVDILGKDMEFNGRTPIWTLALEKIKERYLLGYGYSAFWQSDAGLYIINNTWGRFIVDPSKGWTAHNGFIELTLQLGIIGLGLIIINILNLIRKITELLILNPTIESLWMLEFVAFVIINNQSGTMTFLADKSTTEIYWIIQVSLTLSCYIENTRIHQRLKQCVVYQL